MIDLAPVAVAPATPKQEVAPGPRMSEAEPPPADTPVMNSKPDPAPAPSPMKPVEEPRPALRSPEQAKTEPRLPRSDSDVRMPDLPHVDNAKAVPAPPVEKTIAHPLPLASPQPVRTATAPPKSAVAVIPPPGDTAKPTPESRKPNPRRNDRTKPLKAEEKPEVRRTSAPPTSTARVAEAAAAPASSASMAPTADLASWKGALLALLNRNKRYPAGATGVGTASVAFAVDRAGVVLSARLIASSGDSALDEEAVALLRRSSPVRPPPPAFGRGVITLTVPIRFSR